MEKPGFLEIVKDLLLPPICSICGRESLSPICESCKSKIREIDTDICDYCGRPLSADSYNADCYEVKSTNQPVDSQHPADSFEKVKSCVHVLKGDQGEGINRQEFFGREAKGCSFCRGENFSFFKLRSYSLYKGEMKSIIKKFKYQKIHALGGVLAKFLIEAYNKYYRNEKIDFIDTVPDFLGEACLNHMQILCIEMSKKLGLPFINNIIKIRKTSKQQGLDWSQRKKNLEGAFKVKNCLLVKNRNLLLVDDVWTTGSTLNEISKVLKNSKANKIYLLTIARGVLRDE